MFHTLNPGGAPRRALRWTVPLLLLAASLAPAQASAILNSPGPLSGFFNGYTYDFGDPASNVPLAPIYSAALPAVDGVTGVKVWGSASLDDNNGVGPYFWGWAVGTGSGTLDQDSYFDFTWLFTSPNLPDVPWGVQAGVDTSNGFYYAEISDDPAAVSGQTSNGTMRLYKNNVTALVPAGTTINGWEISAYVGEYGTPGGTGPISMDIPQNSLDLFAVAVNPTAPAPPPGPSQVPEPSTWAMAGAGLVLLGVSRRRR